MGGADLAEAFAVEGRVAHYEPGDVLVVSLRSNRHVEIFWSPRIPGHAMRGTNRGRLLGAIIGKALEPFAGPGTGVIEVLVNVR